MDPESKLTEYNATTGQMEKATNIYYRGRRHEKKTFGNGKETYAEVICSKGHDPLNPQPCMGCMDMESKDGGYQKNKNNKLSDFFAFSIYHLAFYHNHPLIGKDGSVMMKNNGEPITGFDECTGDSCVYCRVLAGQSGPGIPNIPPNSITTVFGRRRYLKMGRGHLTHLAGWDGTVSSMCGTCKASMKPEGFICPRCDTILIDMEKDKYSKDQLQSMVSNPLFCPTCNNHVSVKEASYCPVCDAAGRPWVENKLTDVVLFGVRQGEGTTSTLMLRQHMTIEEFEMQLKPGVLGKPLRQYIQENAKPYDFSELLRPLPLEEQAKKLGVAYTPPAGTAHVPYGQMLPHMAPRPNFGK